VAKPAAAPQPLRGHPTPAAQPAIPAATTPLRPFGPYQLTECVGRGGMAEVYRGRRRGLAGFEKQVVIKTLLPSLARQPRYVRMFTEEARLSAQLLHDNIVRVHDFGFVDGRPFLELEHLTGWNVQQLYERVTARGERIPVAITLALVTAICRGLAHAHSFVDEAGVPRPIVHRDVSPANAMICRDGSIKLLDFGLARLTHGETLRIDSFFGKLAYMSPEQLERRQIDRRADVFGLGAMLHELLVGERLFSGADDRETVERVQQRPIARPSALNPDVPAALDELTLQALRRDPDERFASAREMLAALERVSGAASHPQLLRYLGSVGPEMFATACADCGRPVPCGLSCRACVTQSEAIELYSAEIVVVPEAATPPPLPVPAATSLARAARARQALVACVALLATWTRRARAGARVWTGRGLAGARVWTGRGLDGARTWTRGGRVAARAWAARTQPARARAWSSLRVGWFRLQARWYDLVPGVRRWWAHVRVRRS
jgi:serine/threonine-protein kinase